MKKNCIQLISFYKSHFKNMADRKVEERKARSKGKTWKKDIDYKANQNECQTFITERKNSLK